MEITFTSSTVLKVLAAMIQNTKLSTKGKYLFPLRPTFTPWYHTFGKSNLKIAKKTISKQLRITWL